MKFFAHYRDHKDTEFLLVAADSQLAVIGANVEVEGVPPDDVGSSLCGTAI